MALLSPDRPGRRRRASDRRSGHPIRAAAGRLSPGDPRLARLVINVLALLGLLQLYGLGGLNWLLTSEVGHRVVSGFVHARW